jgi:hypothetical protein
MGQAAHAEEPLDVADGAAVQPVALKPSENDEAMLRAGLFVQNSAGPELTSTLPMFRDVLSARLANKGFSVMSADDIVARFESVKGQPDGVTDAVREASKIAKFEKTEASVDQVLTGASALRIAQMLDANYVIVATLSSLGEERRSFNGEGTLYKTGNEVVVRTLRATIRVLEGNQGGTVYGDTVAVSKKIGGVSHLSITTSDANNELIDQAAQAIADNIAKKISKIRDAKVDTLPIAELNLTSNVEGATVEIDGAVVGSAPGSFAVKPGLHQIEVSKEWYASWRRTINVVPGQVINVTLERSKEGEVRHEESLRVKREDELQRKRAEADIAIAKEQSDARAYATKQVAEGEKEFRKNSHTQIEGAVDKLEIESRPDTLVKVEKE